MQAVEIERVTVRLDRVIADVRVTQSALHLTTPALAAKVRQAFPLLEHHACVNEVGRTFGVCMDCTSLPHLLEHLVIDLQMRTIAKDSIAWDKIDAPPDDFAYVGTTEWMDESNGRARIEVNFTDDLVALRAFRDATRFLNDIMIL